ncbi:MAG: nuclear transport factor 2 family protein [Cyclobacteriaceae bacterium]|nr:nuclear transport factor 2 family protein [Cyclobacteriaceae bacterium]
MRKIFLMLLLLTSLACTTSIDVEKENEKAIRKLFESFNQHNWQAMADCYEDTATFLDPSFGVESVRLTKADIVKKYEDMENQIPDIRDSVLTIMANEDQVWVEFISKGKINDSIQLYVPIATHFTLKNGKVIKDNTYYSACD